MRPKRVEPKEALETIETAAYLVQVSSGVSQEGDGVALPHADGHRGETRGRAVQNGLRLHRHPAGHRAGGVVRTAGVGLKGILRGDNTHTFSV